MVRQSRPILLWTATVAWLLMVSVGLGRLWVYDQTPGAPGDAATLWPVNTTLQNDSTAPTIVMTVHPKCACTSASVAELARTIARLQGTPRVYVLAVIPPGVDDRNWEKTSLLIHASAIPGARVIADRDGTEAARFGAQTSGFTSLYAPDGRLLFSGGITGSRGHEGDNAGEDALVAAAKGQAPSLRHSPVFGCSLFANPAQTQGGAAK